MNGKRVKLCLVDVTPRGLTTTEITNWTGHVMSARRSDLAELLKRQEVRCATCAASTRSLGATTPGWAPVRREHSGRDHRTEEKP
jgi:hypothetical protein